MTSDKLFPFMGKGIAQYGDLNNITDSGFYHVGVENNYQNTPGFGWFCLAVYKSYIITQVAFGLLSSGTWYRTREDSGSSSWSPWKRIDNFDYNTLDELAAALKPKLGL